MSIVQGLLGLLAFTALAWLVSEDRRRFPWRVALAGLAFQLVLALLVLRAPFVESVLMGINAAVVALQEATTEGTTFVFGYLGSEALAEKLRCCSPGPIVAFEILPLVIVISALTAVLTYWGVLPLVVRGFQRVLSKTIGVGGALGLGASANIFVGMVEAPLFIRRHLASLDRSDLFALMTTGMATIAGTMFVVYSRLLEGILEAPSAHLLSASVMSAPAAIMFARIMVPSTATATAADADHDETEYGGTMDAVTRGTVLGLRLYVNILAMLLVLVALVALCNKTLGILPDVAGTALTLERMLGWVMAPVAWLMGIPWSEAGPAGSLLGTKIVLNEYLAYDALAQMTDTLSAPTKLVMIYALCGFANFGSLGIMIGGLGRLMPEGRRMEVVTLGLRSIVAGTLATCCTGTVVGLLGLGA